MATEDRRKSRRERTAAMLRQVDQELAESERERREPHRGVILSALRWEMAARAEAVTALEDVTADLLAEVQQISSRQAGAVRDLAEARAEVAALSSLVRNAESARSDYARERNEADHRRDANLDMVLAETRALAGAVGELYEMQGRLMVELAHRAKQDSVHEDEITGVRAALVRADAKADTALSTAVRAQAKQVGVKAAGWAFGLALFEALRWLMAATGKG